MANQYFRNAGTSHLETLPTVHITSARYLHWLPPLWGKWSNSFPLFQMCAELCANAAELRDNCDNSALLDLPLKSSQNNIKRNSDEGPQTSIATFNP